MSFTYRASVLFYNGHIELIEFDVKKVTARVLSEIHREVVKLRKIDPIYEDNYYVIDCPCIIGNGVNMADRSILFVIKEIKKAGTIDTWNLNRSCRCNFGLLCRLLFTLEKIGYVSFDYVENRKFGNKVTWTGP